MGTRSLTVFQESDGREIVVMYRQFDGYPEAHGAELVDFLKDAVLVNGIPSGQEHYVNGMGDCAAQVVAHMKDGVGGIYLYPEGTRDCGEEYIYTIYPKVGILCLNVDDLEKVIYDGPITDFDPTKEV